MRYPNLFTPLQVGGLTLKNRMVSAPTSLAEMGPGGVFSPENIAYYEPFYLKQFVAAPSHIKGLK